MKVTRFKEAPTVRDVIEELSKQPQDALLVLSSDEEGNSFAGVLDISKVHAFEQEKQTYGSSVIKNGTSVVILYPR